MRKKILSLILTIILILPISFIFCGCVKGKTILRTELNNIVFQLNSCISYTDILPFGGYADTLCVTYQVDISITNTSWDSDRINVNSIAFNCNEKDVNGTQLMMLYRGYNITSSTLFFDFMTLNPYDDIYLDIDGRKTVELKLLYVKMLDDIYEDVNNEIAFENKIKEIYLDNQSDMGIVNPETAYIPFRIFYHNEIIIKSKLHINYLPANILIKII